MAKETISVVIPTLNEADNIEQCIEKINPQLSGRDEIIVVDGGSTDGTISIAESQGAMVVVEEESSIGTARHIGVLEATGSIIATTDADARPPDDWIHRIRTHFSSDPELSVLWGSIKDKNGVPIRDLTGKFSTVTGGASGNNTAYRRDDYLNLAKGYPDISFMEDVAVIYSLALKGKSKRDKNMVMVMDMDRFRYQTIPMIGIGTLSLVGSKMVRPEYKEFMKWFGVGMIATEALYEPLTGHNLPIHHDHIGIATSLYGFHKDNSTLAGAGAAITTHHILTEGLSLAPTKLEMGTDEIVEIDAERLYA